MDTARLLEWNCWYHLMNCGFPLKVSGETDFPCMSGTRVGQGRVYVQPSVKAPASSWDYTSPHLYERTYELGRRDGEAFLRSQAARG